MIKRKHWKWRGMAGHFCASDKCLFSLCTDIGEYRISTVGAYYVNGELEKVGARRHYETFVFRLNSYGYIEDWEEIDSDSLYVRDKAWIRTYDKKAEAMHLKMCEKIANIK